MFKQKTVKVFSIIAIILSILGLLINVLGAFLLTQPMYNFAFFFGIFTWAILLWASIIGYKLCHSYKLYNDEYKIIGIRIYLIIIAFFLFFFVGLIIGLIISASLLATILALKLNYDDWENKYGKNAHEDTKTNEMK